MQDNYEALEWEEPSWEEDRLARVVLDAAFEVHRQLGPGLLESIYHKALCAELDLRNIRYEYEVRTPVMYKGKEIGYCRVDLVVGGLLGCRA
jgi:GxxExxY protein